MTLPYIKIYRDFIDIVRELDNGARGRLLMAIMLYANDEEPDNLTGAERIAFLTIKSQIDRDRDAYDSISEKRKLAGKVGAERRWEQEKMANAILPMAKDGKNSKCHQDKDKDEDKDEDKDKNNISPSIIPPKGIPPTLEAVREYCKERRNSVDPEKFYDFYASKGWMVGKNKMKDWKAAVRTWEHSRSEIPRVSTWDNPVYEKLCLPKKLF